jgi:PilZ domain
LISAILSPSGGLSFQSEANILSLALLFMDVPKLQTNYKVFPDQRTTSRYRIKCPVTVLTPGRGKKRTIARGWLDDISESGAQIQLEQSMAVNARITLDVHFSNPDGQITTMRFQAVVKHVFSGFPYRIGLGFLRGGSFIRGKLGDFRKGAQLIKTSGNDRWVN